MTFHFRQDPARPPWAGRPGAILAWKALLVTLALAVCALAFDPHPTERIDTGWDKLNHLLAFGTLGINALLALQRRPHRRTLTVFGLLLFGAFIELVQSRIPGRSGEWGDLLADSAGIAIGIAAGGVLLRRLQIR